MYLDVLSTILFCIILVGMWGNDCSIIKIDFSCILWWSYYYHKIEENYMGLIYKPPRWSKNHNTYPFVGHSISPPEFRCVRLNHPWFFLASTLRDCTNGTAPVSFWWLLTQLPYYRCYNWFTSTFFFQLLRIIYCGQFVERTALVVIHFRFVFSLFSNDSGHIVQIYHQNFS